MKFIFRLSLAVLLISVASCNKWDDFFKNPKPGDTSCELMAVDATGFDPAPIFRKDVNANTGKVDRVLTSVYSLVPGDTVLLHLRYNGNTIYLFRDDRPADTFLTATFNAGGKLQELALGSAFDISENYDFRTVQFFYSGGRLARYTYPAFGYVVDGEYDPNFVPGRSVYVGYDGNGNVARLYTDNSQQGEIQYTYNTNVKGKRQFYPDAFGLDFSNTTMYLAQFMGWVPDLNPVNERATQRRTGVEEDYFDLSRDYTGHVYDSNGNLVSYGFHSDDDGYIPSLLTNRWRCSSKN